MNKRKLFYLLIILTPLLIFQSCDPGHSHEVADTEAGTTAMETGDEVELTNQQIANIGIEYGKMVPRKIKSIVKLTGRVELPPSGKAIVGSSLDGKVKGIYTQPGQSVRKGQRLFSLENLSIIDWQQSLAQEKAEAQYLRKELARQKTLSEDQISPLKNYESTLAKLQQSEATISGLESKLKTLGIPTENQGIFQSNFYVLAPASGVVQHLSADIGSYIEAGNPLAEIINNSNLHLHLSAFGTDIIKLEKGQSINFFIQSRPEEILEAKIFWINSMVNEQSNSYDVHAKIVSQGKKLISGEFVEARVINQEVTVNSLPAEAVASDKGLNYIFAKEEVHDDGVHFEKLQVQLGEMDLGFVEILPVDPIPENADIVINGAFFLMAQSKKGEGGGGHSH